MNDRFKPRVRLMINFEHSGIIISWKSCPFTSCRVLQEVLAFGLAMFSVHSFLGDTQDMFGAS